MGANTDERLEQAVTTLDDLIDRIGACGLDQSVLFLQMAKLQLRLDWNGITDAEFGAFCDALENGSLEPASRARSLASRTRCSSAKTTIRNRVPAPEPRRSRRRGC